MDSLHIKLDTLATGRIAEMAEIMALLPDEKRDRLAGLFLEEIRATSYQAGQALARHMEVCAAGTVFPRG